MLHELLLGKINWWSVPKHLRYNLEQNLIQTLVQWLASRYKMIHSLLNFNYLHKVEMVNWKWIPWHFLCCLRWNNLYIYIFWVHVSLVEHHVFLPVLLNYKITFFNSCYGWQAKEHICRLIQSSIESGAKLVVDGRNVLVFDLILSSIYLIYDLLELCIIDFLFLGSIALIEKRILLCPWYRWSHRLKFSGLFLDLWADIHDTNFK